jgi:hypothetical protein
MLDRNLMPGDDQCFASVGYVCGFLQITPGQLGVLMDAAGVRFAKAVDGVPYLDGAGFEAVTAKGREVVDEIKSAATSHQRN